MTTYEIAAKLGATSTSHSSNYFTVNNHIVRVANHLPNVINFEEYNSGVTNIILVFVAVDERKIQKFIETEMSEYNVDYFIIEDESDIEYANIMIKRITQ